jgi:hypothetical protein
LQVGTSGESGESSIPLLFCNCSPRIPLACPRNSGCLSPAHVPCALLALDARVRQFLQTA